MYRPSQVIDDSLRWYALNAPSFARYIPLQRSFEDRPIGALRLRIGGGVLPRPAVLILAGLHGNELMVPDILMEFVEKLFFTRGSWIINFDYLVDDGSPSLKKVEKVVKVWDARVVENIRQALDIVILPVVNPDGRELVLNNQANAMNIGRKNRRPSSVAPWVGVDLNRNFSLPAVHGIRSAHTGNQVPVSIGLDPSSETYPGPGPFSEVESRNIRDLLPTHPFECLIDMHMNLETVLYPWGHAPTQTTDAVADSYMDPADLAKFASIGQSVADAMNLVGTVGGEDFSEWPPHYRAGSIFDIYRKAPGSALDYAYSSSAGGPRTVYGFALEIGKAGTPIAAVTPPEVSWKFTPQAFTGLLTILEACAQRVFATPGRVKAVNARSRYSGLYDDVAHSVIQAPRVSP